MAGPSIWPQSMEPSRRMACVASGSTATSSPSRSCSREIMVYAPAKRAKATPSVQTRIRRSCARKTWRWSERHDEIRTSRGKLSWIEAVPLQQLAEVAPLLAGRLRGPRDVAPKAAHEPRQILAVEGVDDPPLLRLVREQRPGQAEIVGLDDAVRRNVHGADDSALELADVARPVEREQRLASPGRQLGRPSRRGRVLHQKMFGERHDVVAPLAQRGQVDRQHVESVVEIRPELSALHEPIELDVGGSHEAHVDALLHRRPHRTEGPL